MQPSTAKVLAQFAPSGFGVKRALANSLPAHRVKGAWMDAKEYVTRPVQRVAATYREVLGEFLSGNHTLLLSEDLEKKYGLDLKSESERKKFRLSHMHQEDRLLLEKASDTGNRLLVNGMIGNTRGILLTFGASWWATQDVRVALVTTAVSTIVNAPKRWSGNLIAKQWNNVENWGYKGHGSVEGLRKTVIRSTAENGSRKVASTVIETAWLGLTLGASSALGNPAGALTTIGAMVWFAAPRFLSSLIVDNACSQVLERVPGGRIQTNLSANHPRRTAIAEMPTPLHDNIFKPAQLAVLNGGKQILKVALVVFAAELTSRAAAAQQRIPAFVLTASRSEGERGSVIPECRQPRVIKSVAPADPTRLSALYVREKNRQDEARFGNNFA